MLAAACLLLIGVLGGCAAKAQETKPTDKLLGTWFDSKTGGEYQFISDSLLIVPHAQAGGGNAVTYRLLPSNRLDIEAGGSHHVSIVTSVTSDRMSLADPLTGAVQPFFRRADKTEFVRSLETSALAAVSQFATMSPDPTIVWVSKQPTGKGAEWTSWSTATIFGYGAAWDWGSLKRDNTPVRTAGGGDSMGYSFTFTRKVPTKVALDSLTNDTSIEATAGFSRIDVGYSASKANYPAGTMVYLPGGLIYSLGNGFAIGVALDPHAKGFVPLTHG